MKVIPEMRRAHNIRYLRCIIMNCVYVWLNCIEHVHFTLQNQNLQYIFNLDFFHILIEDDSSYAGLVVTMIV